MSNVVKQQIDLNFQCGKHKYPTMSNAKRQQITLKFQCEKYILFDDVKTNRKYL